MQIFTISSKNIWHSNVVEKQFANCRLPPKYSSFSFLNGSGIKHPSHWLISPVPSLSSMKNFWEIKL